MISHDLIVLTVLVYIICVCAVYYNYIYINTRMYNLKKKIIYIKYV